MVIRRPYKPDTYKCMACNTDEKVYSLPAGWHGIPVPSKNGPSSSTKSSTLPTTIRKKWNSPMSSEMPRSKLPAYKPLNLRARKNPTCSAPDARSTSKSSCTGSQSELSSAKASLSKELQTEITKLKKELATVKTENSILKVKVRRVDDENIQKSRQIEKLRIELKSVQKVDPTNSKKTKDSELLLLRQKCLRLEGALKEKDLALNTFRKLNNESLKAEGVKTKQNSSMSEAGDADDTKQDNLNETQTLSKSSFTGHSSLCRPSQSSKSEVSKLRDMIHKLEKQNQDLQQQVKDKGEEIRCLKVHLRSQTYIKTSQTSKVSVPSISSKSSVSNNTSKSSVPNAISKSSIPNGVSKRSIPNATFKSSIPNGVSKRSATNISSKTSLTNISSKSSLPKATIKKISKSVATAPNNTQDNKRDNLTAKLNGVSHKELKAPVAQAKKNPRVIPRLPKKTSDSAVKNTIQPKTVKAISRPQIPSKQTNGVLSKQPVAKNGQTFVVSKPIPPPSEAANLPPVEDLDEEVQRMRENIAAKKIQRGWRTHQKRNLISEDYQSNEEHQTLQKAMTFIVTSIKHHKSRKEKLNTLRKRKNLSPRLKVENENVLVEAIQAATKTLWAKELNAAN